MITLSAQLEFLLGRGAGETAHSQADLLEHLTGTRDLLLDWDAPAHVCTAGLFHSVYGTESFDVVTIDPTDRAEVRALAGEDAEELVYLFAAMTRESFEAAICDAESHRLRDRFQDSDLDVPHSVFVDLCNLSAANWLEQRPRLGAPYADLGRDRYLRMLPLVLPAARDALTAAYGFASEDSPTRRSRPVSTS